MLQFSLISSKILTLFHEYMYSGVGIGNLKKSPNPDMDPVQDPDPDPQPHMVGVLAICFDKLGVSHRVLFSLCTSLA